MGDPPRCLLIFIYYVNERAASLIAVLLNRISFYVKGSCEYRDFVNSAAPQELSFHCIAHLLIVMPLFAHIVWPTVVNLLWRDIEGVSLLH